MAKHPIHWIIVPLLFLFYGDLQLVSSQNCREYDITPGLICHKQPCLTLLDFATTSNFSMLSCVRLNLLPGDHNLTTPVSIDNIQTLSLRGNSTAGNTTVTCDKVDDTPSFRFDNMSEVYIHGVYFMNCDIHVSNMVLFTVENCTFSSGDAALIFMNTTTDISSSVFSQLQGLTFGPYANTSGAIICSNSIVTITHSIMDGNQGQKGGAIFADSSCVLSAMNSTFTNNRAEQGGAMMVSASFNESDSDDYGITFSDCNFSGNSARDGGVLYMELQMLHIQRSHFSHNQGIIGGIFYVNASDVNIRDSWFTYNTAQQGGVLFTHDSNVNISDSNFTYNIASRGGVLYTANGANTDIQQSYFANNAAENDGGVIFAMNNVSTGIYNSSFEHNVAVDNGGVLHGRQNQTIIVEGSHFSNNIAINSGGVLHYVVRASTYISDSSFTNNVAHYDSGVLYAVVEVHTSIYNSSFINNSAGFDGGVYVGFLNQTLNIRSSRFLNNTCVRAGGAIYSGYNATTTINDSYFTNNRADSTGGALVAAYVAHTSIYDSRFSNNSAKFEGGAFSSENDQIIHIYNSSFESNRVQNNGGAVDVSDNVSMEIYDSTFTQNIAGDGGAIHTLLASTNIDNCFIANNIAQSAGGGISAIRAPTNIHNSIFESNLAEYAGGAINVYYNEIILINGSIFRNNTANDRGGVIHCAYNTSTDIYDSIFIENSSPSGGAIFAFDYAYKGIYESNQFVNFSGKTILENNRATEDGGALLTVESTIYVNDQLIITNNTALHSGGGIYLHSSQMGIRGNCTLVGNNAEKNGGGLFSISSSIVLQDNDIAGTGSLVTFTENEAILGGGMFLVLNSKLYVVFLTQIANTFNFIDNNASFGGAIFVADEANQETCIGDIYSPIPTSSRGCFIQTIELLQQSSDTIDGRFLRQSFNFTNNEAEYAGDDLFGGLLDRCTVRYVRRSQQDEDATLNAGLALLSEMSNINLSDNQTVSSHAIKVYLCLNDEPDYRFDEPIIQVERGEPFTISVVAVDQANHPLKAVVRASLSSARSGLSEGQHSQEVNAACTNLTFTVTAPDTVLHDTISLYANGPCGDAKRFERKLLIEFTECKCPVGFQRNDAIPNSCRCICHRNITKLVRNCNSTTTSFIRKQNSWISYLNSTNTSDNVSTYYLLGHQHCPYDYCYNDQDKEDEISKLCASNRAGILCGKCQPGFSVSLGSSKCLKCTNSWPALLILVFSVALIAGAASVFIIFFLNITVAVGTINGIIFYANIIAANSSVLVRLSSPSFPSIFISWLNLNIGFDTCFYDGMDTYAKTWLQMAFPAYLIILMIVVIIGSKYSQKFAKLIGKRNPVATLATLILLSYATILSAILNIMSNTDLMFPDGQHTLWLPDAHITFLKDPKHILLFLVGILIIVVGAAYTVMLFSWQWLLQLPDWKIFRWTRFPRLNSFMETYHIPYNYKYRYWNGLLLIVRVVVYLVSALNRSGDPKVPLLATILVIGILILLDKDRCNNSFVGLLESSIYSNILVLAAVSWYTIASPGSAKLHIAAVYISTLIIFAELILVIVYHSYRHTKLQSLFESTKLYRSLQKFGLSKEQPKQKRDSLTSTDLHHVNRDIDMFEMIDYIPVTQETEPRTESTTVSTPTVTIVDITKERKEKPPNPALLQKHMVISESACSSGE
jgi:predicted outer membrane repeat protein